MDSKSDDKTLFTDGKEKYPIKWLYHNASDYVDRTTLIFGGTNSGKTTIIEEIMYFCRHEVPNYVIAVPRTSDKAYRSKLDPRCISETLTKKKLQQIWRRQVNLTQCCSVANDINILEGLVNKIADRETHLIVKAINSSTASFISMINNDNKLNYADKRAQIAIIDDRRIKKLKKYYKKSISSYSSQLMSSGLSEKERIAIEYLYTNPRLMLIIDDCTEKFKGWMKMFAPTEDNVFESILFRGRHNGITLIIAAHDDKYIDTQLRKNARLIKYTTSQALIASLQKAGSAFNSVEKKQGVTIASKIFGQEDTGDIKNYKKVCFVRDDPTPWKYTIANIYDDFKVGCAPLDELIKKMPRIDEKLSVNPFVKNIIKYKKE